MSGKRSALIGNCFGNDSFDLIPDYQNMTTSKQPRLYLIAAMSENRVIGRGNELPWHLPDEWENFKKVTGNRAFIMGSKSFLAPDALHSPYRNVILSSKTPAKSAPDVEYAQDISQALALLSEETEVFVLGGASVFEQMLPLSERLYLTIVHAHIEGDAVFPAFDEREWELADAQFHSSDERHDYAFSMNVYHRKKASGPG